MWQQWTNTILGIWVLAIPFLGFTGTTMTWALVITGAVIAVLAFWGAGEESTSRSTRLQHS